jgi:glucosamine--fructose-6-phosphate aminotransferase (isomerizing)
VTAQNKARMSQRSPLLQQVDTLPELVRELIDPLLRQAEALFSPVRSRELQQVYLTGCGDSYHAGVNAEMAFSQLAGLPCRAATAMQFGRYIAPTIPPNSLVLAVSVSGMVSRTIEALDLAGQAGALTAAVTGNRRAGLAEVGKTVLHTAVPALSGELKGLILPGARSYIASQLALYLLAIQIGQDRRWLNKKMANVLRRELADTADQMEAVIAAGDHAAREVVLAWQKAQVFVYCGSGPNFGTALFSAAKLLEASGDTGTAQDMEEWAHLEYFAREPATPTILISAGGRDQDRALEVATAAKTIGRRLAIIAPLDSALAGAAEDGLYFPLSGPVRECFSPMQACLPGLLLAAHRAEQIGEVYFRGFGGGRSIKGGGGISRIRKSHRLKTLPQNDIEVR